MEQESSTINYIKSVETKRTPSGKNVYEVFTIDGQKYATFRPEIAEQARLYEGNEAKLFYRMVEKNGYQNYYLNAVEEVEHPIAQAQTMLTDKMPLRSEDKDVQIARAVALKAAVEYLSIPEQERETLDSLLDLMNILTDALLGR